MNYIISLVWIVYATLQSIIVQPKFFKRELEVLFDLYEINQSNQVQLIKALKFIKQQNSTSIHVQLEDLKDNTDYEFKYQVNLMDLIGNSGIYSGKFKTFSSNQNEFSFVASTCARSQSNSRVFTDILDLNPDFMINVGDMHYSARNYSKLETFVLAYHEIFKQRNQRNLYQSKPLIYTFDDHDFGSNNADGLSDSHEYAHQAYRDIIPNYGIQDDMGIYQNFKVGKVNFILLDGRTFKNTYYKDTNIQMKWLEEQIIQSAKDDNIEGVILLSSLPWSSKREWNVTTTYHEKEKIGKLIEELGFNTGKLNNKFLALISGDYHLLSYDTGLRNDDGNFPVFQCSPLDSKPTCKSGGFEGDIILQRGGFCQFKVDKHRTQPNRSCLGFKGYIHDKVMMTFNTCDEQLKLEMDEKLQILAQVRDDETIPQIERSQAGVLHDMILNGSICPATPMVKIQALFALFGLFLFIIATYNIMRNICYVRIE
ncbi:phosphodiesterase alkaline phosphatase d-like protein [Stylonychia lemnae]|uniref:Phosphodiesterase alkaline phosphatase d-like protein n=1 Tax=Stylonychia lemnae TaxID=5949 RepID=A0A078ANN7_STYLE|nr:phosphodiesterase alkaline phosphatase d-like protein [Stylonychia lemnae]|eukprot:CDW82917.1 phosphodiesterase alkaline phosphatase d-like protein [Stylonychia lemnae]